MLQVVSSRSFSGKKDPTKTYFVANLIDDKGNVATDVFTETLIAPGSYVVCEGIINASHKLVCVVRQLAEKK